MLARMAAVEGNKAVSQGSSLGKPAARERSVSPPGRGGKLAAEQAALKDAAKKDKEQAAEKAAIRKEAREKKLAEDDAKAKAALRADSSPSRGSSPKAGRSPSPGTAGSTLGKPAVGRSRTPQ